jgi:quinolinate synthase
MAMNGLRNLIAALENQAPQIQVEEATRVKAETCIRRMLDFTARKSQSTPAMSSDMGAA